MDVLDYDAGSAIVCSKSAITQEQTARLQKFADSLAWGSCQPSHTHIVRSNQFIVLGGAQSLNQIWCLKLDFTREHLDVKSLAKTFPNVQSLEVTLPKNHRSNVCVTDFTHATRVRIERDGRCLRGETTVLCGLAADTIVYSALGVRINLEAEHNLSNTVICASDVSSLDKLPLKCGTPIGHLVLKNPCPRVTQRAMLSYAAKCIGVNADDDDDADADPWEPVDAKTIRVRSNPIGIDLERDASASAGFLLSRTFAFIGYRNIKYLGLSFCSFRVKGNYMRLLELVTMLSHEAHQLIVLGLRITKELPPGLVSKCAAALLSRRVNADTRPLISETKLVFRADHADTYSKIETQIDNIISMFARTRSRDEYLMQDLTTGGHWRIQSYMDFANVICKATPYHTQVNQAIDVKGSVFPVDAFKAVLTPDLDVGTYVKTDSKCCALTITNPKDKTQTHTLRFEFVVTAATEAAAAAAAPVPTAAPAAAAAAAAK